jgi:hypothetical protein
LKRNQLSKLAYGFQKTKESITPQNIVSDLIGTYSSVIPYGAIVSAAPFILNKAIPFIKNWFTKEKIKPLFFYEYSILFLGLLSFWFSGSSMFFSS